MKHLKSFNESTEGYYNLITLKARVDSTDDLYISVNGDDPNCFYKVLDVQYRDQYDGILTIDKSGNPLTIDSSEIAATRIIKPSV